MRKLIAFDDETFDKLKQLGRDRMATIQELADEAFRAAVALIDSHREQLDALAGTLLTNEVLERDDIVRIMGDTPPAAPSRRVGELSVAAATALNPARPQRRDVG